MGERVVTAEEAQAQLKDLLDFVREGHEVLISEGDGEKAFARIAPVARRRRKAGLTPGVARMAPDFDDPLPDSFWFGEE